MIANVTIAHLSACRFIFSGESRTNSREKIRLTMGTLKRLSEHWTLGKRTYREIGIIARELLSLAKNTPVASEIVETGETVGNVDLSLQDPLSLELPALGMTSDADFDFCAFFDSGTPGLTDAGSFILT